MSTETITKKLFTVDDYFRMCEAGILPEERRFELIRGEIIEMPHPGKIHSGRVDRLNQIFSVRLGAAVIVRVQNILPLDRYSVPLPDLALLKPRADFYETTDVTSEDVFLVVEVSHTTMWYDSNVKAPLYAEMGIAEYWQLDVEKRTVIVRTDPAFGKYRKIETFHQGETLYPQKLPGVLFSVDEMIGR